MVEKILVVEDDKNLSKLVVYNLEKANYEAKTAFSGEEAVEKLKHNSFDLVLLDIMLPEMDGFEVCKLIRKSNKHSGIPIIMVSAKGEEVDKILGFELGVDDYVVKPFSPRELLLRIAAVIKRVKGKDDTGEDFLKAGNIEIDIVRHKITVGGAEVVLTLQEFKLLVTLIERRGRVQSRDSLLENVWDMSSEVTTRTIDTHIKRLRQKLGEEGKLIETIRGIGYRFKENDKS